MYTGLDPGIQAPQFSRTMIPRVLDPGIQAIQVPRARGAG